MFGENKSLEEDIKQDIQEKDIHSKEALLSTFEKMTIQNLCKQDKKILLQYCEDKGLIKDWSTREKQRATRLDLAKLIKPTKAKQDTTKPQNEPLQDNIIDIYRNAFLSAVNNDFKHLDALALNNVNSLILDGFSSDAMSEETAKKLKVATSTISGLYLIVRFTGGLSAWKNRTLTMINFLKKRVKKQ